MMALSEDPEFSRFLTIEEMHEGEIKLQATEQERAELSKRFDIENIEKLEVNTLISGGRASIDSNNITLNVSFTAVIIQKCVATLIPVRNEINSSFVFELGVVNSNNADTTDLLDDFKYDEVDFANVDADGGVNLGELVAQYLGIEIDPFPRSNSGLGEITSYLDETATEDKNNPFSILKDFKRN